MYWNELKPDLLESGDGGWEEDSRRGAAMCAVSHCGQRHGQGKADGTRKLRGQMGFSSKHLPHGSATRADLL